MFDDLVEIIAEIIYDSEMERDGWLEWKIWDALPSDVQEDYLQVAEEIIAHISDYFDGFDEEV